MRLIHFLELMGTAYLTTHLAKNLPSGAVAGGFLNNHFLLNHQKIKPQTLVKQLRHLGLLVVDLQETVGTSPLPDGRGSVRAATVRERKRAHHFPLRHNTH